MSDIIKQCAYHLEIAKFGDTVKPCKIKFVAINNQRYCDEHSRAVRREKVKHALRELRAKRKAENEEGK